MNETDRAIAEKQQATILGMIKRIKDSYSGYATLISELLMIESSAEVTMDILDRERNETK